MEDIPRTLAEYLRRYVKCSQCVRACFEYSLRSVVEYDLVRMAKEFSYVRLEGRNSDTVPLVVTHCSQKCYNQFFRITTNV